MPNVLIVLDPSAGALELAAGELVCCEKAHTGLKGVERGRREPLAELPNNYLVRRIDRRSGELGPIDKDLTSCVARTLERTDNHNPFARQPQGLTAGGQDDHTGARRQQTIDERNRPWQHMFAVVDNEKGLTSLQRGDDPLSDRLPGRRSNPQHRSHGVGNRIDVCHRR